MRKLSDMSDEEFNARAHTLNQIGYAIRDAIVGMLDRNYDCNCVNCRSYVARVAQDLLLNGESPESAERQIRATVMHQLHMRRDIRNKLAFAQGLKERGVDPTSFPKRPT